MASLENPPHDPDQIYPVREDTLLLLEAAEKEAGPSDCVLEVGTGSGYIARHIQSQVVGIMGTDINPHAVRMARDQGIDVVQTDLVAGLCGQFDLVLFNPPYLPTKPDERKDDWLEFALDGGGSGRRVIGRFAREVGRVLAPEGRILLVVSSLTGPDEVEDMFRENGMAGRRVEDTSLEGEHLFVYRFSRLTTFPPE